MLADIPGLIEGAADGAGIGDRFLGHIERCRVLLHLVDATGDDPIETYHVVRGELDAYGGGLVDKPEVLALNKVDAIDAKTRTKLMKALKKASGVDPYPAVGCERRGPDRRARQAGRCEIGPMGGTSELSAQSSASTEEEPWSPL